MSFFSEKLKTIRNTDNLKYWIDERLVVERAGRLALMQDMAIEKRHQGDKNAIVVAQGSEHGPQVIFALRWGLRMRGSSSFRAGLSQKQRNSISSWWRSEGVGIDVTDSEIVDVRYTGKNGIWNYLSLSKEYEEGLSEEPSLEDRLKLACQLASPFPDYRFGKGDQSFLQKPITDRTWSKIF